MPGHDIIVVGFSAGGLDALARVVSDLPAGLQTAVFVVHHFPPSSVSALPQILTRSGRMPARHAVQGEPIVPGTIYVAPPDHHLLLSSHAVLVTRGPRENGHRPAIDPLFRTAAKTYGSRVIALLLSGTLDDGTVGLNMVKERGGIAVVQDPEDATYSGMISSALEHVSVDYVVPVSRMASLLVDLVRQPAPGRSEEVETMSAQEEQSPDPAIGGARDLNQEVVSGPPSGLTCPECGGALWELQHGELMRYRCHVGHAYTVETMVTVHAQALESALWSAIRALEEKAELSQRLGERATRRGWSGSAAQFQEAAREARRGSEAIRSLLNAGVDSIPLVGDGR
jgi:two-component system, chemotaxis family, protein-glutamate methylesterase/glutaminase